MVAEGGDGENPLPFSLTATKRGGGGGGGGRGSIPASFPSRSPPPKQPFQPGLRKIVRGLGGFCGERPGLKTLGSYHNPQSADLGGRWMVSEGFPSSLQHFSR